MNGCYSLDFSCLEVALFGNTSSRNVVFVNPSRQDNPYLNQTVSEMNKKLQTISFELVNVKCVSLDSSPRSSFTQIGLRLNSSGNCILANLFLQFLEVGYVFLPCPDSSENLLNCKPDFNAFEKRLKHLQNLHFSYCLYLQK